MKIYKKPEIEIVEFFIEDIVTAEIPPSLLGDATLQLSSDEVFYGIDAGEEGYIVE